MFSHQEKISSSAPEVEDSQWSWSKVQAEVLRPPDVKLDPAWCIQVLGPVCLLPRYGISGSDPFKTGLVDLLQDLLSADWMTPTVKGISCAYQR
jgi:hypothetical protein